MEVSRRERSEDAQEGLFVSADEQVLMRNVRSRRLVAALGPGAHGRTDGRTCVTKFALVQRTTTRSRRPMPSAYWRLSSGCSAGDFARERERERERDGRASIWSWRGACGGGGDGASVRGGQQDIYQRAGRMQ